MSERGPDGKFLPGNQVSRGNRGGARPTSEAAERLRVSLEEVISNGTLPKWKAAMKRKLEHGDQWATEFVFNRILGKVPDEAWLDVTTNGETFNRTVFDYSQAVAAIAPGSANDSSSSGENQSDRDGEALG